MSYRQKADRTHMKQTNQQLVLHLIQSRGPISRKDIARISGLSPATVSGLTGELIDRGLVHEVGEVEGEGRTGRPAILLRLNSNAGYVIGVKLALREITCVLTDLDANVLHAAETPSPVIEQDNQGSVVCDAQQMIRAAIVTIEHLLASAQIDSVRLLGIGVSITGIVDADNGISRFAPLFHWRDVPIAAPLAAHFDIPIYLENDVRALTIAEQWFGAGRGIDHFVTAATGYGIGAGVVINGHVYRGAQSGAGEFGHTVLQLDGPLCSCGQHGCVEALAAIPAIQRQIRAALAAGATSSLAEAQPLTFETIAAAADAGDALARQVLADAGRWLGLGLASLVNSVNPRLLIINGEAVYFGHWYFDPMETALHTYAFDGLAESLKIMIEPSGTEIWARGAACVVLGELFSASAPQPNREAVTPLRKVAVL